jgi:glycine/D-amino acid oxidase-like deaminating enzyme
LIGETGIRGLLLAAGHTCWGIQNSCATGKLVSEFVFDGGPKSARIDSLDPRRVL